MDELKESSEILALQDLRTKAVRVKAWDRIVRIRELDLDQGMQIFAKAVDNKVILSGEDIARVVAFGVIDENGERLFSDEDIPKLTSKSRNSMMFLYQEIMGLSGTVDDAVKNSGASQR